VLEGHTDDIYFLSLPEKTGKIILGSYDNDLSSWELKTGKRNYNFGIHNEKIVSVTLSNNNRFAASTYRDGRIKVIDLLTGKLTLNINGHSDWATAAVFSKGDSLLITRPRITALRVWRLPEGSCLPIQKPMRVCWKVS
jgi:WD40 repeat protein